MIYCLFVSDYNQCPSQQVATALSQHDIIYDVAHTVDQAEQFLASLRKYFVVFLDVDVVPVDDCLLLARHPTPKVVLVKESRRDNIERVFRPAVGHFISHEAIDYHERIANALHYHADEVQNGTNDQDN